MTSMKETDMRELDGFQRNVSSFNHGRAALEPETRGEHSPLRTTGKFY